MIKLYNTYTKNKDEFKSLKENEVSIYTCGVTVYSDAHIGNMRTYIFSDILRKMFKLNGYKVNHVMNITDVGHLVSDEDTGEDKMIKASNKLGVSPYEIAKIYTEKYQKDFKKLNIEETEKVIKATSEIEAMEKYVDKIVENGYAYETKNGVYFDTKKLTTYGELSKINMEELKAGARIEVDENKKNPLDFALWIKAPKNHIMQWNSKYGSCYPGWHIECSAISKKYLGEVMDIHTGGVDHINIHHENEIAQSRGATGKLPANYWMHGEFLLIDGGKMSKSLGNVYTITTLQEKGYDPLAYRLFTYSSSYRNKLNFTFEALEGASNSLKKLRELYKLHLNSDEKVNDIEEYRNKFLNELNDDLNMPNVMAVVYEVAKKQTKSKMYADLLKYFDKVLSIDIDKVDEIKIDSDIEDILEKRKIARENKDFNLSDVYRDKLLELGYKVLDTKEGQKLEKI